ncbi:hypothetical protein V8B55DRAFT_1549404 [Mucor lusitanicus]|uniref:R3H domain-containing protein n=2 Tax=Mucor circinelloides f. lusitanicus TaxID=29924 RepID=A0A8H4EX93_MUCCL|nr:hypothetical protein FB192DRAFT_1396444 [Mucor lusitanicus]
MAGPSKPQSQQQPAAAAAATLDAPAKKNNRRRNHRGKKKNPNVLNATEAGTPKTDEPTAENDSKKPANSNNNRKRNNKKPKVPENASSPSMARISKNRAQGRLTEDTEPLDEQVNSDTASTKPQHTNTKKRNNNKSRKNTPKLPPGNHDMATLLSHELKTSSYECMICMDVVRPAHHVWSCDCCWAVFHLNCVQTWAGRSLKDTSSNKMVTGWRCPGCQNNRTVVPKDYLCFCGKQRNPETSRYNTPHSCDQLCKRHKSCPHECVLPCHPGPCPPCSLMGPVTTCFCGTTTRQARCVDTDYSTKGFSCEEVCDELLGCGKHRCEQPCHAGVCSPCQVQEVQSCYCGRHERTARCGSGKQVQLRGHIGHYSCAEKCDAVYSCGQHRCQKSCHPCSANSQVCPFDPNVINTCPCGSHTVVELLNGKNRESCTDPVPTCESTCNKISECGHPCSQKCHLGDCPPCEVTVDVPCRCQSSTFKDDCANVCEATGGEPPLCDRICKSMRNCGRHQCGVQCCLAMKVNGKRKPGLEFLHDCPEKCNLLLSCGNHRCQDTCHKGKCLPCLEATFDEVACNCGRTRLEPPVRCGTKMPPCPYPCVRPNPCGHIRFLNHNCHPDDEPCPPCPALVTRHCLCGKTELKNVPCYRESPRCGRPCEKPLSCGKHVCLKTCHSGPCIAQGESCTQICGGARKSCGHLCQQKCHDGTPCPETEPCAARVKATCKCGQNTLEIPCNATSESSGSKKDLDCNDFCAKVLRNRRLAMAFDIKRDDITAPASPALSASSNLDSKTLSSDDLGYYDDSLREFYLENAVWCRHMENSLIEFVQDADKKSFHCKPMRSEYRRFIHRYAVHFNVATEAIDQEPKRSIIMRKTLGPCRIPPILLSKAARNPSLNRAPTTVQGIEADTSGRSANRQPVNALYLSDMAFGLTKLELDADLAPLIKIGDDTIHFTSKWVNENDAIVIPSISDSISMDEKEAIIWQLKKIVKSAFITTNGSAENKAARVDCCWVNQKGEVTWNEKQLSAPKKDVSPSSSTLYGKNRFVNAYDALKTVDDDGWMKVGGDNPYRPAKDAWIESPKKSVSPSLTPVADAPSSSQASNSTTTTTGEDEIQVDKPAALASSSEPVKQDQDTEDDSNISDDWETLLDEE